MENSLYIALSKQSCLWRNMESTANNLANMNTVGYKATDPLFTQYVNKNSKSNDVAALQKGVSFVQDMGTMRDLSSGPIQHTGNNLDIALEGEGFFTIETAEGEKYSRNGKFSLNNDGMIVNSEGYPLVSESGAPFFISPEETSISISNEGTISTENGALGKIKIAEFSDPQALTAEHSGLYKPKEGNSVLKAKNTKVIQGSLEGSNVQAIPEMTKLISIQRQFEYVQKMIDTENQRQNNAINVLSGRNS